MTSMKYFTFTIVLLENLFGCWHVAIVFTEITFIHVSFVIASTNRRNIKWITDGARCKTFAKVFYFDFGIIGAVEIIQHASIVICFTIGTANGFNPSWTSYVTTFLGEGSNKNLHDDLLWNDFDPSLNVPSHGPWETIMMSCLVRQLNTSTSQLFEKVLPFDPQTGS